MGDREPRAAIAATGMRDCCPTSKFAAVARFMKAQGMRFPNVGAVYDRPQSVRLHSSKLWAVIDGPYIGESHSFTAPTTAHESKYLKLSPAIDLACGCKLRRWATIPHAG